MSAGLMSDLHKPEAFSLTKLEKFAKEKPPSGEFSPEHHDMQQKSNKSKYLHIKISACHVQSRLASFVFVIMGGT